MYVNSYVNSCSVFQWFSVCVDIHVYVVHICGKKLGLRENYRMIHKNVLFLDIRCLTKCNEVGFDEF